MIVHLLKTNAGKLDKHNAACDVTSTKSNAEINLVTCSKCKAIHNRYYESDRGDVELLEAAGVPEGGQK